MNNDRKKYLDEEIKPIMADLTHKLATERPENTIEFILENLLQYFNYSNEPLTPEEKEELKDLRMQIKQKRSDDIKFDEFLNISNDLEQKIQFNKQKSVMTKNSKPIAPKKLRLGISAEVFGIINKKENFELRVIKKSEDQIHRIKSKILNSFLFKNLDQDDIQSIILAMEEKYFEIDELVIRQNDNGECLYIVEKGELLCTKFFKENNEEIFLKKYGEGDSFGELALLYNTPRAASIRALKSSILWSLDRNTFNCIIKDSAKKKRDKYEKFLLSIDILSTITSEELFAISDALKSYRFKAGDMILKEVRVLFFIIFFLRGKLGINFLSLKKDMLWRPKIIRKMSLIL